MVLYKIINIANRKVIKRTVDNVFIPLDPANTDYQEYLAWLAEGNEPEPPDEPPQEEPQA